MNHLFQSFRPIFKKLLRRRLAVGSVVAGLIVAATSASALAIQPGKWEQGSEPDFQAGKREQTVVSNLGEVALSSQTKKLAELPIDFNAVYDMAVLPNGDVYLAAGSEKSEIFKWADGKLTPVLTLKDEQAFALAVDDKGRLLVAVSGEENTRVSALVDGKLELLVPLDGIRYVWDMAMVEGRLALTTGTPGRLLLIDLAKADGKPLAKIEPKPEPQSSTQPATQPDTQSASQAAAPAAVESTTKPAGPGESGESADTEPADPVFHSSVTQIIKAKQNNFLSLAVGPNMSLYAGSDTEGLVYRVYLNKDFTARDAMVIYDAAEPEIGALLTLPDGTVFVGTADTSQADRSSMQSADGPSRTGRSGVGHPGNAGDGPMNAGDGPDGQINGDSPDGSQEGGADPGVTPTSGQPASPVTPSSAQAPKAPAKPAKSAQDSNTASEPSAKPTDPAASGHSTGKPNQLQSATEPTQPTQPNRTGAGQEPVNEMAAVDGSAGEAVDPIRAAINQKLNQSTAKPMQAGPAARPRPAAKPGAGRASARPGQGMDPFAGGVGPGGANAIYRISPDGFVHEVFRDNAMIFKIVREPDGKLLIGTGNGGVLYRLDPIAGEYITLADLEPEQVNSVIQLPSGQTLLATSNPGQLIELDKGYAESGTFTSSVFDASQISLWGNLSVNFQSPAGTKVKVQTRSGNVEDPENGPWSAWSEVVELTSSDQPGAPSFLQIQSPPARFLQYKVTLEGTAVLTPVLQKVDATFVVPNLRPKIAAVRVSHPNDQAAGPGMAMPMMPKQPMPQMRQARPMPMPMPGGAGGGDNAEPTANPMLNVEWEASDPNNDRLTFTLEYRKLGSEVWLPVAKDLVDTTAYEWQSLKVPDGRYQARLTASDALDNPANMALTAMRVSAAFVVDNTPPAILELKVEQPQGVMVVTGMAEDAISTIRSIHYSVDGAAEWKMIVPNDMLFDSTKERFTIRISDLSPGEHVVSVRAVDGRGNPKYASMSIVVK